MMQRTAKSTLIPISARGLLRQQWFGEFSLGISLWGIWVAIIAFGWLLNFVLNSASGLVDDVASYFSPLVILVAYYGIVTPAIIWWLVGAWRAAGKSSSRWATPARMVVCALAIAECFVLLTDFLPKAKNAYFDILEDPEWGPRSVELAKGGTEVEVHGYITRSVVSALREAIESNSNVRTVTFDSAGGALIAQ